MNYELYMCKRRADQQIMFRKENTVLSVPSQGTLALCLSLLCSQETPSEHNMEAKRGKISEAFQLWEVLN